MRVLNEGTRLADRYTLIRRLGSGGMSIVWLARDRHSETDVALKFLVPERAEDPASRERFRQEWRIGSRLMHTHIARVFEFHDDPDGPFYSQQFIAGPEIRVLTGAPAMTSLRPFCMIADALRYAHGKDIVHRDVKAANVLLDRRGLPYLIDFGVAGRARSKNGGSTRIAASPQQRAGENAHPADDIYALGVLIHETLTANPPDSTATHALDALRNAPALAVAAGGENEGLRADLIISLVSDMLAPQADQRPDAVQVVERLRDAGVQAGPAPTHLLGEFASADTAIAIESVSSPARTRFAHGSASPAGSGTSRGVSPMLVWGGLAVLAAILLSVLFWLPATLETRTPAEAETASVLEGTSPGDTDSSEDVAGAAAARDDADPAVRASTEQVLGELLSKLERLRLRGIERWGGQTYLEALDLYAQGDQEFLARNYRLAGERYRAASELLDPFFGRIDATFRETLEAAQQAFNRGDHSEAVRLFDLAVAITPGSRQAQDGLARASNLETVLRLTEQGLNLEKNLELEAARAALQNALDLDPSWQPAQAALERVRDSLLQRSFEQRMSEGLEALAAGNYPSARVAFEAAKTLRPGSRQPVDGLLQVDQEVRLGSIRRLESEALALEASEQWQDAIAKYEEILEVDGDLQFAREGLANAQQRAMIHRRLQEFIDAPDSLSAPATMQTATQLLLNVTRITPMGPRLEDQKNELSRLLKRAATPLTVQLVSDNATDVSIFRVGHLGAFARQEVTLRPGAYVALGSRPGFRDVRLEFRVAPEIEMSPIVIICEERI
jgi:eukaryotic-like serine/threonine-protein kinase